MKSSFISLVNLEISELHAKSDLIHKVIVKRLEKHVDLPTTNKEDILNHVYEEFQ